MYPGLSILLLLCAAVSTGAKEWERYQVILDKHPFGELANVTNAAPDFAKNLRLNALWQVFGQLRAGFEDSAAKRDFVLSCGERAESGLELVSINFADESVVVRQGNEVAILRLQASPVTNAPAGDAATTANPWRTFYDRYRQRQQQDTASNQPPAIILTREQLGQRLQEQQMQAIRTGAPPLPVPLTPESDNQLVREGALPPRR